MSEEKLVGCSKAKQKKQIRASLQFFKFQFLAVKLGFTLTDNGVLTLQP